MSQERQAELWRHLSLQTVSELLRIQDEMIKITSGAKVLSDEEIIGLIFAQRLRILADGIEEQANATLEAKQIINDLTN